MLVAWVSHVYGTKESSEIVGAHAVRAQGRWPDPNHNLVWRSTRPSDNTFRHRPVMQWQLSGQIGGPTGGDHQPEVGCSCLAMGGRSGSESTVGVVANSPMQCEDDWRRKQ